MAVNVINNAHNMPQTNAGTEPVREFVQAGAESTLTAEQLNAQVQADAQAMKQPEFRRTGIASLISGIGHDINIPYNETNQIAQSFLASFLKVAEQIEGIRGKKDWELVTFSPVNAIISSIIFIRKDEKYVTAYTFMLESTMISELTPKSYTFPMGAYNQQQTISVKTVTEDIWTTERNYSDIVREFVQRRNPSKEVILVSALNINRSVKPEEEHRIRQCLFYANVATQSVLNAISGNVPAFNLAQAAPDENLSVRVGFTRDAQVYTATGIPVRRSIAAELVLTHAKQNGHQYNPGLYSVNGPQVLGNVFGYLDFHYVGDKGQAFTLNQFGQQVPAPMYQPAIVITALDQPTTVQSLEQHLLTLSSVTSLVANDIWSLAWAQNYTPNPEGDVYDIGAITMLASYGDAPKLPTDTRDSAFNYTAFINQWFRKDVAVEILVGELSELNFIDRTLLEAAGLSGQDKRVNAEKALFAAANNLTNGAFDAKWHEVTNGDVRQPLVVSEIGRVERGYYVNQKGEPRDLSFIDTLWLANTLGQTGSADRIANDWLDSYEQSKGPEPLRIAQRTGILEQVLSGSYTITGYAQRLTLNPLFILALDKAVKSVKPVSLDSQAYQGMSQQRGFTSMFGGMNANQVMGLYTPAATMGGGANFSRPNYWGAGFTPMNNGYQHGQPVAGQPGTNGYQVY